MLRRGMALVRASHPEPSAAVTVAATVLALGAGLGTRSALVAAAVGTGQVSVGWGNDWLDRHRDRQAGRHDKPVASDRIGAPAVRTAAVVALAISAALTLLLGSAAAPAHLVFVASGWLYNVYAKRTWWSIAPWAVAFGLLPAVVTLTAPLGQWPAAWIMVAGALLGSGAHLANALPDLAADAATGVHGLPHRLGPRRALWTAVALLGAGVIVVTVGLAPRPIAWVVAGLGASLLSVAAVSARRGRQRRAFRAVIVLLLLLAIGVFTSRGGV